MTRTITLIPGDGIGPEVTSATRRIIDAAGADITWEVRDAGAKVFKQGLATGLPAETVESIKKNKIAIKGPLETPVGFGEKSANVTLRKMFEMYGNIRPILHIPGVPTPYSGRHINTVIVRENVEDLYAGIEHMQTPGVAQCLKLISRKGCERIIHLAFEFARSEGRRKVHCATKANIMKLTEGIMKRAFEDVAPLYPDIQAEHIIVDNCAHMMVKTPEMFDVIVTTNMNGDILSDLGSALVGGLGFAPGANIGDEFAIFEAVHGSAPSIAGKNLANPTALLLSGVMMLRHIGEFNAAEKIEHALALTVMRDKYMTGDIKDPTLNHATTEEFADKIIGNLGDVALPDPSAMPRSYTPIKRTSLPKDIDYVKTHKRETVGVDIFIETHLPLSHVGDLLTKIAQKHHVNFKLMSCRGVKVYPLPEGSSADVTDSLQCRFVKQNTASLDQAVAQKLLADINASALTWGHVEMLYMFDDKPSFTKAHGEE